MYRARYLSSLACVCMLASTLFAQKIQLKEPTRVADGWMGVNGETVRYSRTSRLPEQLQAAITVGATSSISSIPHWTGSFKTAGVTYAFTMAGAAPAGQVTTRIGTSLVAVSLFFDEYVDSSGHNIVLNVSADKQLAATSPNFESASYGTGFTQFADAVQRAEFHKANSGGAWHTLLAAPRTLTPVTIEVPPGTAQLFVTSSGKTFAEIDANFFLSQLNTIAQLEGLKVSEVPIVLAPNVLLYENGNTSDCCILGFHTAYMTKSVSGVNYVQTFVYATWLDPGIFQDPDVQDTIALSHELSELINDPFVNNTAPKWQFPDKSGCQANLETGDPIHALSHPAFEVVLHGFTYHPQTEALLQWFARTSPSDAYQGAYSYPDTTELTSASTPCPN